MSHAKKTLTLLAAAGLGMLVSLGTVNANEVTNSIRERLEPVGSVCMSGDDCAAAPVAAASSSEPRTGTEIYSSKCFTCHDAGVSGAPKLGDVAAWAPRLDQGMETLYTHAIQGFNAMPAKGLCMDCSDDEIRATVDYMVEESR